MQGSGIDRSPVRGHGAAWELATRLQSQILSGDFAPGSRLPAYRELMETYQLTSGTVSYAMSILAEQGFIERHHGSGVYVREAALSLGGSEAGGSGLTALVLPDIESGPSVSLQAGMSSAAQDRGEQLITMATGGSLSAQADMLLQLVDRSVSGIALVPPYETTHAYQLRHLHRLNVPVVLLHRGVPGFRAPLIDIPFAEIGRQAAHAIADRGHDCVGAFLGLRSHASELYLSGLRQGLVGRGIKLDDQWILWSDTLLTAPDDYARHGRRVEEAILSMLSNRNRPTALFVSFDRLAELVYFSAVRHGLSVPGDLSIVSFGDKRRSGGILPRVATVAVDDFETGRRAYELLVSMQSGTLPIDCDDVFTMKASLDVSETLDAPFPRK